MTAKNSYRSRDVNVLGIGRVTERAKSVWARLSETERLHFEFQIAFKILAEGLGIPEPISVAGRDCILFHVECSGGAILLVTPRRGFQLIVADMMVDPDSLKLGSGSPKLLH